MSRPDGLPSDWEPCGHCNGGRVSGVDCTRCAATGFVPRGTTPCPCYGCRSRSPRSAVAVEVEPVCECGCAEDAHGGRFGSCLYCGGCKEFKEVVHADRDP